MCGIVGFMNTEHLEENILDKMLTKIKHRGPDGQGKFTDGNGYLGHCRLSIIDMDNGNQPMFNNKRDIALVYNGEIYNYIALKEDLINKGHIFYTKCDSEVLIHGYEEYGYHLVEKLRGMFSFVIYDMKKKLFFGARDHFGIKPFYYCAQQGFIFASEAKAILEHPDYHKELDESLLPLYLKYNYIPLNKTLFKGIEKLEAGHYFIYQNNQMSIHSYFHLDLTNETTTQEEVQHIMKDSVKHHLLSDVEVGSFLSSGIDSSYIVALSKVNNTYTVGYDEKTYDEIHYAQNFCHQLHINNHHHIISKDEYFESVKKVVYYLDEPLGDPSAISLYHLAKLASQDVKVVLSGEGADEFFGGYNSYKTVTYDKIPFWIRNLIAKGVKILPNIKGKNFLIRHGTRIEEGYIGVNSVFDDYELKNACIIPNKITNKDISSSLLKGYEELDDLSKKQIIDIKLWLEKDIFLKGDRMSMANSLECRVPFSDIEVYHIARKLAPYQRVNNEQTKILLREAYHNDVDFADFNKKKLGFPVPLREWIKDEKIKKDILEAFDSHVAKKFFNTEYLKQLYDDHYCNRKDNYKKIWVIYIFILWYRIYFEVFN